MEDMQKKPTLLETFFEDVENCPVYAAEGLSLEFLEKVSEKVEHMNLRPGIGKDLITKILRGEINLDLTLMAHVADLLDFRIEIIYEDKDNKNIT